MVRLGAAGLDQHVSDRAAEGQVGERVAMEMAQLAPSEAELDPAEAVRVNGDALPASDLGLDAGASVHLHVFVPAATPLKLVLDWDGTCTVDDSLVAAILTFGDATVFDRRFGSYGESLAAEVATIRATADEASAWAVEHVRVRPGFHELVDHHSPVIVSSGLPQLILPVLAREGVEADVRCNDADPRPGGWRIRFRDQGVCAVCGDKCKRRSLPEERPLVYVGDGISDRCAALSADRVFARAWLATHLDETAVPYEPFETLHDVAAALP